MKKNYWKILGCFMMLMAFFCIFTTEVSAEPREITGFVELDEAQKSIIMNVADKPAEAELVAMMPAQLEVYLEGSSETEWIDVEWFHILDEYEESEAYYFQFSPSWDETKYVLSDEIDLYTEAPYIAVFLQETSTSLFATDSTIKTNEQIVFEYLTEKLGYNIAATCGIMANIYGESAFNPINLQGTYETSLGMTDQSYTDGVDKYMRGEAGAYENFVNDRAGYGLCQWTYPTRKADLLNYAMQLGTSIGDANMQLSFLEKELKSSHKSLYNIILAAENTADGAYQVGYEFCYRFEKPANYEVRSVERGNLAVNTYWAKYQHLAGPFTDVSSSAYYYEPVMWAYEGGITTGMDNYLFNPEGECTRAQAVTFLWRTQGSPAPKTSSTSFEDISSKEYYYQAVLWAYENGITNGKSSISFAPDDIVTREEFVTFLWRTAGEPKSSIKNPFTDVEEGAPYTKAILWAYENDITKGTTKTTFTPKEICKRCEVVTFLYRYCVNE